MTKNSQFSYRIATSTNGGHTYVVLPRGVVLAEWAKQTIQTLTFDWPTYTRSASGQSGDAGKAGENYYRLFTKNYTPVAAKVKAILQRADAYERTEWEPTPAKTVKPSKPVTAKAKAAAPQAAAPQSTAKAVSRASKTKAAAPQRKPSVVESKLAVVKEITKRAKVR